MFKYSDIQYNSLTLDEILNRLVYRTLFCVNIYWSYELLNTVRFLAHPVGCSRTERLRLQCRRTK